jgi:hypothetical protein
MTRTGRIAHVRERLRVEWPGETRAIMRSEVLHTLRELDARAGDGIHVRLLWSEDHERALVAVADEKTADAFAIEVPEGESASQVFAHPYAYVEDTPLVYSADELAD